MNLRVNGEEKSFASVETLEDLLLALEIDPGSSGYAVAVNDVVVSRLEVPQTQLREGDRIEVVHAVQGG